jgi:osmotically-inducible protein OsmY
MTDDELRAMVGDELLWDPRVDSDVIAVSVNDGEVIL